MERRKKTLLVEYKNMGKNNAFVDRRFGEHTEGLSEEDKALLRLQRQRLKDSKTSKFALVDGEEEGLTHMGASLGAGVSYGGYVFHHHIRSFKRKISPLARNVSLNMLLSFHTRTSQVR